MILVLGGTTEGRRVAEVLDEAGTRYYYSTRGTGQNIESAHAVRVCGGMDTEQMATFCTTHGIRLLIDAAHPFAVQLHATVDSVAHQLAIPVVRYERHYPPIPADAVVCKDWDDAVERLEGCHRLLALTGVETIAKLKPHWQRNETWFRILDRPSSWALVEKEGFPKDHIITTDIPQGRLDRVNEHEQTHSGQEHNDSDAAALTGLEDCVSKADAIIVKEAGTTGWWDEKVKLARDWGVTLYVVRRPQLPVWPEVTGPHGLRRAVEHAVPSFFPLHSGLTTGSCATAAAVEALLRRLGKDASERASILLPNGEEVSLPINRSELGRASVVKDGGSDPDATHGCTVVAEVRFLTGSTDIVIEGGEGVGRVTMPGLGLPVGSAAINIVPQQMIRHNLRRHYHGGLHVTIAVPQGREIAQHTFNPRLGIVDGISIIGTTGIVRPFSNEAFVEAMRRQMQVAIAMGTDMLVLNSGLRSERAVRNIFANLPSASFVHYGNFIGDALKAAATLDIRHVALCVMLGKAVKLAAGNLNTHSHQVTMDRTLLAQWLEEAECDDAVSVAATINMARELPDRLTKEQWQRLKQTITNKCIESCKNVYPYTLDFYLLES